MQEGGVMTDGNAIVLQHVVKKFNNFTAVNDFNVEIKKGEFFSLLGPSGCGKTTTLRMIAGLEKPTSGSILLESAEVNNTPAYKRHVNTVFQDYALFPHMTVKKNIFFPLKMSKMSLSDAEPKIQRVLQLVNMDGFEHRLPQQLSGGQRQRIALARSLVNEPAALLLDEPLGALDFKLRISMQKVLKDIQRDVGITFIYVTHDQTEAMTMSDRIAVMRDGKVHQIGTPKKIYNSPATAFVASFIGDMNFITAVVKSAGKPASEAGFAGNTVYYNGEKYTAGTGESVLYCIRTERITVDPKTKPDNLVTAEIERVVFRGTDYEITCSVGDTVVRIVENSLSRDHAFTVGDTVTIGWATEDVVVFPICEIDEVVKYETGLTACEE